ncbi:MAG: glycosyl transferase [Maricaulis sp.]|jgi:glycosyltransferase involved in cell wall biosynthesis|nr:glycosyl transferase [Maricaulis sp.]HAQ36215.1 glycosyltransferase family 2 protein [Alphaproteobacteria bacterium]|tara:strand:+ start:110 stop:1033 length:924 start_codon:yes stop_codon:yes gene_type:complete
MTPDISVIIPTFRRPEGLHRAVTSILAQANPCGLTIELVVVDNDPEGSARDAVETLSRDAAMPVHYVHARDPGVANARNAGLAKATGEFIAFLDDDEEAPAAWLCEMLGEQRFHEADVVFGPVLARLPDDIRAHRAYYAEFFSREGPEESGVIDHYYGCGNSLVRRAALPDRDEVFSASRNDIGGEDDLLFAELKANGARFAWCAEAFVWEDPLMSRTRLGYTLRRAFAYGQGPSAACAAASPANLAGIVYWMMIGAGQFAVFGSLALVLWLTRAPHRARMLDKAIRGLGKLLWGGPFKLRFYGAAA